MISIWPFVQSDSVHGHDYNATGPSKNFQAMLAGDMLVKDAATGKQAPVFQSPFWEPNVTESHMYIMDPFNPKTRAYVFKQMTENYMKYGIKTFWLDEAEPERHVQDIGTRYGYHDGTDAEIGLAWSRAEQQMVYEGLRDAGHAEDDIFMLSRSFFIGGAKYGAGAWSGDIPSTFESLQQQIRVGQNVAISGIHWWTTDIGGYSGGSPTDPVMKELLIRWFQVSGL
jgi:alpha-D-xyloside xylohydrolase